MNQKKNKKTFQKQDYPEPTLSMSATNCEKPKPLRHEIYMMEGSCGSDSNLSTLFPTKIILSITSGLMFRRRKVSSTVSFCAMRSG